MLGATPVQVHVLNVKNSDWFDGFAGLQLGYGEIVTSGQAFSDSYEVRVITDPEGYGGESPLLVSFMVPTWILLGDKSDIYLSFNALNTRLNEEVYKPILGESLRIFGASLDDAEHVHISKNMPNLSGRMSICRVTEVPADELQSGDRHITKGSGYKTSMRAVVGVGGTKIMELVGQIELEPEKSKELFGETFNPEQLVYPKQVSAFSLSLPSKDKSVDPIVVDYPIPFNDGLHITISRNDEGHYFIDTRVDADSHPWKTAGIMMYHTVLNQKFIPAAWNTPYINLAFSPMLDNTQGQLLGWLPAHINAQCKASERGKPASAYMDRPKVENARMCLKETIGALFQHFMGLGGIPHTFVFHLVPYSSTHLQIILVVSSARFDLSNRSLVLDAALLSVTKQNVSKFKDFVSFMKEVDAERIVIHPTEMGVLRRAIASWVERCRVWSHRADCEYSRKGSQSIPLSLEGSDAFLCSCGNGVFPNGYLSTTKGFDKVRKYAVRAAISPIFYSSLVETSASADPDFSFDFQEGVEEDTEDETEVGEVIWGGSDDQDHEEQQHTDAEQGVAAEQGEAVISHDDSRVEEKHVAEQGIKDDHGDAVEQGEKTVISQGDNKVEKEPGVEQNDTVENGDRVEHEEKTENGDKSDESANDKSAVGSDF